jgi:monofunctional biosynthetic peptidoglycan transglycosylase
VSARASGRAGRRRWPRVLAVLLLAAALWVAWEVATWPEVARLARERPTSTAFIERYRAQARAAGRSDRVAWAWAPYGAIAADVKRAVVVAEDIGFFSHRGFDLAELEQALRDSVRDVELPRGASTITQQVAKNLWLTPSRNPWRKIKEAILTWQLERALSKRRILELYLNVAELGPGVYGVEAAARRYFGRGAAELGPDEAAQLAAALPRPSEWHPGSASSAYRRRVSLIRLRMDRARMLDRQIGAVRAEPFSGNRAPGLRVPSHDRSW